MLKITETENRIVISKGYRVRGVIARYIQNYCFKLKELLYVLIHTELLLKRAE